MLSAAVPGRPAPIFLALLLGFPPQGAAPRYTAEMLRCTGFREAVRTDIRSESGGTLRQETAGREGLLIVQAVPGDSGPVLTAWYDSLTVWRQEPEGRIAPDAEGLLGGRWRGTLSPEGRFAGTQVPFIPDEVAEIAEVRGVLGDFFPPLAPGILKAVSAKDGRYEWRIKARTDTTGAVNDTLEVRLRRESVEEGTLTWDRRLGPVAWERRITVTGGIEAKGPIKRGIRSVVSQRIRVTRLRESGCG